MKPKTSDEVTLTNLLLYDSYYHNIAKLVFLILDGCISVTYADFMMIEGFCKVKTKLHYVDGELLSYHFEFQN